MASPHRTRKVASPTTQARQPAPTTPPTLSDNMEALEALEKAMLTYGFSLVGGKKLSRRGLVKWLNKATNEKQLKQGGLTLANEKIAQIARAMVREGQFEDPELAKLVATLASNLEAAKPVAALLRKLKTAEGAQTRGGTTPAIGTKPVETEQGRRYPPINPKTREQLEKEISEPLRAMTGRQFVVVTPDGKQFPIALKAADIAEIRRLVVANPEITGFFQSPKTRPSGEQFDPVVKTEVFDRNIRQAVLRQLLGRMKSSGQYPKGSKIMELDTNRMGNTLVERTRSRVTPGTATPAGRQRVGATLAETYEESMSNRDEYGRVRQGGPTIGKTADLRTPKREFSYDLPNDVDLVVDEGRMLFSYPGSSKPEPIDKVVAYYKAAAAKNPDLLESAFKVQEVEKQIKFIQSDPTAKDVLIDRAGGRKPSNYERISEQDEQRAQDRRAFRTTLEEDVAPKDRGSFARRKAAEEADIIRAGAPGRGPRLATRAQMNKLRRVVTDYEKFMRSQGVDEAEIQKFLNGVLGKVESYKIGAESVPGEKGKFERYTRYVIPNLRGKGGKAVLASTSEASLRDARIGVATSKDMSDAIREINDAVISARIEAGATPDELINLGYETSSYRGGKRPFNAPTTKSMMPGAFARKGSEQGIIAATEKEAGTKLRTQAEDDVKRILKAKTKSGESSASLYEKLLSLMDKYQEGGMSPSTFMRIAKTVDPQIDELIMERARSAEATRMKGGRSEAAVRSELGDVAPSVRRMTAGQLDLNQALAGKSQQERRATALAVLAEVFPQLEGTAPQGLGVEIKVPPNLRGSRSAEQIIAGAERRGAAATKREQQKTAQSKMARVAAALQELENPSSPTMRRAAQTRRREETGADLKSLLRKYFESTGESSDVTYITGKSPRLPTVKGPPKAQPVTSGISASEPRPYAGRATPLSRPTELSAEDMEVLRKLARRLGRKKGRREEGRTLLDRYGLTQ